MVTVVRPGFYFVCGGGSMCRSALVRLLLGAREGGRGFMAGGSLHGCQRLRSDI